MEQKYTDKIDTAITARLTLSFNKTQAAVFLYYRFSLFLKDPFFQVIKSDQGFIHVNY